MSHLGGGGHNYQLWLALKNDDQQVANDSTNCRIFIGGALNIIISFVLYFTNLHLIYYSIRNRHMESIRDILLLKKLLFYLLFSYDNNFNFSLFSVITTITSNFNFSSQVILLLSSV